MDLLECLGHCHVAWSTSASASIFGQMVSHFTLAPSDTIKNS